MNALTAPLKTGQMPAAFSGMSNLPDMNAAAKAGVSAGFAVVGYKGRNWRLKHGGTDELLKGANGAPLPTLDVVIVGISPHISKIWYEKRYTEGDDAAPDCWSVDGIVPEATAPKRQSNACATCPHNAWGSRITDAGKKGKSCQDSRRIAVVPAGDIDNETYGGPMLLRVPPMSLSNLVSYANDIGRFGAQPFMVRTQLGFNYDVAYPHLTFTALGWITDDVVDMVADQMKNPLIERILHDEVPSTPAAAAAPDPANATALAGGPPAGLAGQAQATVDAQAEAARIAAQRQAQLDQQAADAAAAQAQAALLAQQQAAAQQAAQAQAAAAQAAATAVQAPAPAAKASPFGGGSVAAAPMATAGQVQQPALAQPSTPETAQPGIAEVKAQLAPAPDDMEAAINALLT